MNLRRKNNDQAADARRYSADTGRRSQLKRWFVGESSIKAYRRDRMTAFFLMLPMILLMALLSFYPVVRVISMGMHHQPLYSGETTFTGFENWRAIFQQPIFVASLWNNLVFAFGSLAAQLVIGLLVALVLNKDFYLCIHRPKTDRYSGRKRTVIPV